MGLDLSLESEILRHCHTILNDDTKADWEVLYLINRIINYYNNPTTNRYIRVFFEKQTNITMKYIRTMNRELADFHYVTSQLDRMEEECLTEMSMQISSLPKNVIEEKLVSEIHKSSLAYFNYRSSKIFLKVKVWSLAKIKRSEERLALVESWLRPLQDAHPNEIGRNELIWLVIAGFTAQDQAERTELLCSEVTHRNRERVLGWYAESARCRYAKMAGEEKLAIELGVCQRETGDV